MTRSSIPGHGRIPAWSLTDRLRKAREDTGLSQQDFADELGISRNSVGNYEAGRTSPRRLVLQAWALATGVDLHWLETGEQPHPERPGGEPVDRAATVLFRAPDSSQATSRNFHRYAPHWAA